jgi:hypothetical protein
MASGGAPVPGGAVPAVGAQPAQQLRRGAVGFGGVLFQSVTFMAPAIATAFSIPAGMAFGGGATPLAVILALVASLFVASSIAQLARHMPSAGSFYAAGLHARLPRHPHLDRGGRTARRSRQKRGHWGHPASAPPYRTAGSASGPGKRTGSNPGTAPQADSTIAAEGLPVELVGQLRSDRVLCFPAPLRQAGWSPVLPAWKGVQARPGA